MRQRLDSRTIFVAVAAVVIALAAVIAAAGLHYYEIGRAHV